MSQFESDHYPREFSFQEILLIAWNIYKKNYTLIFTLVFVVQLPVNIIIYGVLQLDSFTEASMINIDTDTWIILITISIFSLLQPIGIISLVKSITIREDIDFKLIIRRALNSLLPVAVTMFMMIIFLIILTMALIIPGIIFTIFWIFTLQVVVVTGLIGIPALRRSFYIVRKRWWRVFLYTLIISMIGMVVYLLGAAIKTLFGDSQLLLALIYTLIAVPMAYSTVAFAVMFINFNDTVIDDPDKDEAAIDGD